MRWVATTIRTPSENFQERASEATAYQDWRSEMMGLVGIDI